jgi:hypothetical protein
MNRRIGTTLAIGFILAAIAGCGDESAGDTPAGDAPHISDLSYSPNTGTVNQQLTIIGQVVFTDVDADANRFAAEVRGPGLSASVPATAATGVTGHTEGTLIFQLTILPPVAGDYEFDIWMIDAQGNLSNRLTGAITVS